MASLEPDDHGGTAPTDKSRAVERALVRLIPFERIRSIVEVGCGRGALARRLARRPPEPGRVIAFDLDREAIRRARRESRTEGPRGVEFRVANAYDLPLETDSADLVVCCSLLCSLTRPSDSIREMVRVARPGGFVAVAEPVSRQLAYDPDDKRFTVLSEKLSRAFARGWASRRADQRIGLRVPGLLLGHGLEGVSAELATQVHLISDPRRPFGEVVEQLDAEAAPLPAETSGLLSKGGMSRQDLGEHHLRAGKRRDALASDPSAVAGSGYVRIMAPLLVTVGVKSAGD